LELYDDKLFVKEWHFSGRTEYEFPLKAKAKIRYRQEDQECEISYIENLSKYIVKFTKKQRAITSGQICVVYV
jgi:tRNA-specific 2-thiouridylase